MLEKRALALDAFERIRAIPHVVIDSPPQLSLFPFHVEWPGASIDEQNAATRELLERVTRRGKVMLSGFTHGDRFMGRVCILSFRTRHERVDICVEHLEDETHAVVRAHRR